MPNDQTPKTIFMTPNPYIYATIWTRDATIWTRDTRRNTAFLCFCEKFVRGNPVKTPRVNTTLLWYIMRGYYLCQINILENITIYGMDSVAIFLQVIFTYFLSSNTPFNKSITFDVTYSTQGKSYSKNYAPSWLI